MVQETELGYLNLLKVQALIWELIQKLEKLKKKLWQMYERISCQDHSFSRCIVKYVEMHWRWCSWKLDRLELVEAQVI